MIQFTYTAEAWAALARKPEDRTAAIEALVKQAGGRLISIYYHFGEYDGTVIAEAPDDVSANATVLAVLAGGAVRSTKTTRLFTTKEAVSALEKAGKISYQPPVRK